MKEIPPKNGRSKQTTVRLSPELREILKRIEAKSNLKIAQAVRLGILKVAELFEVETDGRK